MKLSASAAVRIIIVILVYDKRKKMFAVIFSLCYFKRRANTETRQRIIAVSQRAKNTHSVT